MMLRDPHSRVLAGILLITFLIYAPALSQSFVSWDDEGHITENYHVRNFSLDNFVDIFRSDVNRTYIPLTISSFSLEHRIFGLNPFVFHLNNILFHLGVIIIVYALAIRLGFHAGAAGFGSLLFAVHPMHVESVVWLTQRKDVLYSLFYVAGLYGYVLYVQKQKMLFYSLALLAGFLSVLAKPMALSLPLILFLFDWFLKRNGGLRLVVEKLPFMLLVFPVALVTYAMNMRGVDFHFPESLLTWLWCLTFYLVKFIFPFELSVLYQLPQSINIGHSEFFRSCLFLAVLIFGLFRFKNQKLWLFAAGYYFLSIFFLLRFDVGHDLTFVADRFMYLPSLGFCLFFGWGVWEGMVKWKTAKIIPKLAVTAAVFMLAVFAFLTHQRVRLWGNEKLLWSQAAERYPGAVAYSQLGNYYLKNNDLPNAQRYYLQAMAINPSYSKPVSNYGLVLLKLGQYQQAVEVFTRALVLDHESPAVIYNNRGYAYLLWGQNQNALDDFNLAIGADQRYIPAYLNRATLFKNENDYARCEADLRQVLWFDPSNRVALNNIRILRKMSDANNMR